MVKDIPEVKYHTLKNKVTIGYKRNVLNSLCKGEIIVNMDDDDYYPPERVSHCVETLVNNREYLIAGCDKHFIYFGKPENNLYTIGPYQRNHATAATYAYRKALLKTNRYDNTKTFAEERSFLNNYTVPMIQMNMYKSIVVFAHIYNTVDKKKLLTKRKSSNAKKSNIELSTIIKNDFCRNFILKSHSILRQYKKGHINNKKSLILHKRRSYKKNFFF